MSDNRGMSEAEKFQEIIERFMTQITESEVQSNLLLRLNNFHTGIGRIFTPYFQTTITFFFMFFLLLITCVVYKKKMIGVFQGIFLLSNFFEVLTSFLEIPLIIVFFFIADPSVPMPFPWCAFYINLRGRVKVINHLIASYLSLLLAINRICALFLPFKMNILFSKKRSVIYCCIIILCITIVSGGIGLTLPNVITKTWVDDIWGNKKMELYTACAFDEYFKNATKVTYRYLLIELILLLLPPFCLVAMNIVLIRKLHRISYRHNQLHEATNQNKRASRRIYAMTRIAIWVSLSFIAVEVPLLVLKLYSFYYSLQFYIYGFEEAQTRIKNLNRNVYDVIYECLMPVNLIMYFILSKKLRKVMRQCIKNAFTCKDKDTV